jgi:hypothetical protein
MVECLVSTFPLLALVRLGLTALLGGNKALLQRATKNVTYLAIGLFAVFVSFALVLGNVRVAWLLTNAIITLLFIAWGLPGFMDYLFSHRHRR